MQHPNRAWLNRFVGPLVALVVSVLAPPTSGHAQVSYERIHSIGVPADERGTRPVGTLVWHPNGLLFGTAQGGGSHDRGTVFQMNPATGEHAVLHHFDGAADGGSPDGFGGLVAGPEGLLFGATASGGVGGAGTIFRLNPDGTGFTVLHAFTPAEGDGGLPTGLLLAGDGVLYGFTAGGGIDGAGTVFRLERDGSGYAVLHRFQIATKSAGYNPYGRPVMDANGRLYGRTIAGGGALEVGVVFALDRMGDNYSVLHRFGFVGGHGGGPSGLVLGRDNSLYGVTGGGGRHGGGYVFKLGRDGTGFQVLWEFAGGMEGQLPNTLIPVGVEGTLFGTTVLGGSETPEGPGTLFRLNPDGTGYEILHRFGAPQDGVRPFGALIVGGDGRLWGTTPEGGAAGFGTVFSHGSANDYRVVRSFLDPESNGFLPNALVSWQAGWLCGTTGQGGLNRGGTVFTVRTDGRDFRTLHRFDPSGSGLTRPVGRLSRGQDGWIYGALIGSEFPPASAIYKVNPATGEFAVVHRFVADVLPLVGVPEADGGIFFGTTYGGGHGGIGSVFRLNVDGTDYRLLHSFTAVNGDGANPRGLLTRGADGLLYGTTYGGGTHIAGTVFRLADDGSRYAVVHEFAGASFTDGANPLGELLAGRDQRLYGVTEGGGRRARGTLFSLGSDGGDYRVLFQFTNNVAGNRPIGAGPNEGLVEGPDGQFYGSTARGGELNGGILFRFRPEDSTFTVLKNFGTRPDEETFPSSALVLVDGDLFGTTQSGGEFGLGTIFRLSLGTKPAVLSVLGVGEAGVRLELLGSPGQPYQVQTTPGLFPPDWQPVGSIAPAADGRWKLLDPTGGRASTRFYRAMAP